MNKNQRKWLTISIVIVIILALGLGLGLGLGLKKTDKLGLLSEKYENQNVRAVIVEPRKHPALGPVLNNMCTKLPDVPITVIHGTNNRKFAHEQASRIPCVTHIKEVNAPNLNLKTYSKLLTSEAFWDAVGDHEKTLIFQTDSGICGDGKEFSKYKNYDYCGAPWNFENDEIRSIKNKVGNGGFSIRDTAIAKKHIREHGSEQIQREDVLFSKWCESDPNCNICPKDIGNTFADETMGNNKSWAFHNNYILNSKSICKFNDTIRDLNNALPKTQIPAPDEKTWRPNIRISVK